MDIWKFLAGVAIFMLGMRFLETSLQAMAGRPFKLFLKKQSASRPRAILGGAVVTGLLQSSSVVNLMVLAFVGANVIQMQQALAIMLGSNLGTTLSSWIVATLGFSLNLEHLGFPIAGIFGILFSLLNKENKLYHWSGFLLGFGFLFIGLEYMKTGMEDIVNDLDLSKLNTYPVIVFLLIGFLITSVIQSSSATIAIVLSALYVNAIGLYAAMAIVLGSEVGTTIKLILASIKGLPAKKRVALGNLLFNVSGTVIIFIFLWPIHQFITEVVGFRNNLYALVFFQTLVNGLGIILFYPFLNVFGKFLERRYVSGEDDTLFIHKVNVAETELALVAMENETRHFLLHALHYTNTVFELPPDDLILAEIRKNYPEDHYNFLKQLHGEAHEYAIQLQHNKDADTITATRIQQLISACRNTLYAAKNVKDALADIEQLRNSSNDVKYRFYKQMGESVHAFSKSVTRLFDNTAQDHFNMLKDLFVNVTHSYSGMLKQLSASDLHDRLNETEISTLLNFNREMYTAYKSFLYALKDYLLLDEQAAYFEDLPGFIR